MFWERTVGEWVNLPAVIVSHCQPCPALLNLNCEINSSRSFRKVTQHKVYSLISYLLTFTLSDTPMSLIKDSSKTSFTYFFPISFNLVFLLVSSNAVKTKMWLTTTLSSETRLQRVCHCLITQNNLGLSHHTGHRYQGRASPHSWPFEQRTFLDSDVGGEWIHRVLHAEEQIRQGRDKARQRGVCFKLQIKIKSCM